MKLILGLGNPGIEYEFTPHNAGFLAIDRIADSCGVVVANRRQRALTAKACLATQHIVLAKPETFMNLSGLSAVQLVSSLDISNLSQDVIVLYDELDLSLGRILVKERGSANGHNGVKSLIASFGTEEFIRVRIGVGKPSSEDGRKIKSGGQDYLLSPMSKSDLALMDEVLNQTQSAVETIISQGVAAAMSRFNRRP